MDNAEDFSCRVDDLLKIYTIFFAPSEFPPVPIPQKAVYSNHNYINFFGQLQILIQIKIQISGKKKHTLTFTNNFIVRFVTKKPKTKSGVFYFSNLSTDQSSRISSTPQRRVSKLLLSAASTLKSISLKGAIDGESSQQLGCCCWSL